MGETYQEQKKDLVNEEFILFMVQKCTSKVILVKRKNVRTLEIDTYKKQYKYSLVIQWPDNKGKISRNPVQWTWSRDGTYSVHRLKR